MPVHLGKSLRAAVPLIAVTVCVLQLPIRATEPPLTVIHQAPRKPGPGKPPLLVLLHGFGASEKDLLPMAARLDPHFAIKWRSLRERYGPAER